MTIWTTLNCDYRICMATSKVCPTLCANVNRTLVYPCEQFVCQIGFCSLQTRSKICLRYYCIVASKFSPSLQCNISNIKSDWRIQWNSSRLRLLNIRMKLLIEKHNPSLIEYLVITLNIFIWKETDVEYCKNFAIPNLNGGFRNA